MQQPPEFQPEIYDFVKEYLRFCDLNNTYDSLEREIK